MVRRLSTLTQWKELRRTQKELLLPEAVNNTVEFVLGILDDCYGATRDSEDTGGYLLLLTSPTDNYRHELEHLINKFHLREDEYEYDDIIHKKDSIVWHGVLYLVNSDYAVYIVYPAGTEHKGKRGL